MNVLKISHLAKCVSWPVVGLQAARLSPQRRGNQTYSKCESKGHYGGVCHRWKILSCSAVLGLFLWHGGSLCAQDDNWNSDAEEFIRYSIQLGEYTDYFQEIYGVYAFESIPPKILDDIHELDSIVYNILHEKDRFAIYAEQLEEVKRREIHSITSRLQKYITDFESLEDVLQRSKSFFEAYSDARYPVENSLISRLNTQLANITLTRDLNAFHSRVSAFLDEIDRLLEKYQASHAKNDAQRAKMRSTTIM